MSLLKAIIGVVAVIFSIQPLAAWAAGKDGSKAITIHSGPIEELSPGGPLCGGGPADR